MTDRKDEPRSLNPSDPDMRSALDATVASALPLTPQAYGIARIRSRWGADIDPQTTRMVTLDYDRDTDVGKNGVHHGKVTRSRTLIRALLDNYQTVADGAFGEDLFGLYTPPDIGPTIVVQDSGAGDTANEPGYLRNYEGIYRQTSPQVYGPSTQLAIRAADFKRWVWNLELRSLYRAYLDDFWPADETLLSDAPYPLRTAVKAAFIMSAYLQRGERSLTPEGLALALRSAGLPADLQWKDLTFAQLQAATRMPEGIEFGRLAIYRYTAKDIGYFLDRVSHRVLLHIPGNSSPLHEFKDTGQMAQWFAAQGRAEGSRRALAAHFAAQDIEDGLFHAGVLTALDGMGLYPKEHWLGRTAGFFNNDGYWNPDDYVELRPAERCDPFAQGVLTMKQAALAGVDGIRDDAQVNRDELSAVVEPVVQWINRYAPLALFVPGGEGVLALAGLIDAGYGLDAAVNGSDAQTQSEGLTRTVFGLLNALPMAGELTALKNEARALRASEEGAPALLPAGKVSGGTREAATVRPAALRALGESVASFTDEALRQIERVVTWGNEERQLTGDGRTPFPLLADAINRFRLEQAIDPALDPAVRAEQFSRRYLALQRSENGWVRLFQEQYPGLPKEAIEQLFERADIDAGRAFDPKQARRALRTLDGKARHYQAHARLDQAYAGLYLRAMNNPDTDRLVLHTLRHLPGWPSGVAVQVLDSSISGRVLERAGAPGAQDIRRLIKVGSRYRASGGAPDEAVDLFRALPAALTEQERSSLGLASSDPAGALRLKVGEHALPRGELQQGLQRTDAGLAFESWSRLAGGGFPPTLGGQGLTVEMDRLQVKELYPEFDNAQADAWLHRAGLQAQSTLAALRLELDQLNLDLNGWIGLSATDIDEMDIDFLEPDDAEAAQMTPAQLAGHNRNLLEEAIAQERAMRTELAHELMAIWQKRPPRINRVVAGEQREVYRLDLAFEDYFRLPVTRIRFEDVFELSMRGVHVVERESLDGFLESFPNLLTLNLESADLRRLNGNGALEGALPPSILRMRHLTRLNLRSTFLELEESTASQFRELTHLQELDLSDNPLSEAPVVLGMGELRVLNLRNTGITRCPIGIPEQPCMTLLNLAGNRIERVPPAVFSQAISRERVLLWGNPLSDEGTLERVVSHRRHTGINLWLNPSQSDVSVQSWLREGGEALKQARRSAWTRVAAKPSGGALLRMVSGLSLTADFLVGYVDLQARVWTLLLQADAIDELWGFLSRWLEGAFGDAENPFVAFGELENRVRFYRDWVALGRPVPMNG
ncbi:dermonecrotic toxin domain-containing protein [Pseudomonas sp. NPDC089534]|uniref:dermonecrotic toxin domain-containing protein n=1 Tax=Pseudomonas sp. NPDC089534 TaxID=3364468 RepID=UPI00380910C8